MREYVTVNTSLMQHVVSRLELYNILSIIITSNNANAAISMAREDPVLSSYISVNASHTDDIPYASTPASSISCPTGMHMSGTPTGGILSRLSSRSRTPGGNITSHSATPSATPQLVTGTRSIPTIPRASDIRRTPVASHTSEQSVLDAIPARTPRSFSMLPVTQGVLRDTTPTVNDISIPLVHGTPGRIGGPDREEMNRASDSFRNPASARNNR